MDEQLLLKSLLKKTFSSSGVEGGDLDSQLSSACLQYLTEKVEFKLASRPDSYLENLKDKYHPINSDFQFEMDNSGHQQHKEEVAKKGLDERGVKGEDSIPRPRRVLYDAEKVQMEWGRVRGIGLGLTNMGNTCFLNSVLQCLCYTTPLHRYLTSGEHKTSCE